jgi:sulfur-carrier protein
MAKVIFTANIQRHVACPDLAMPGRSVREVLDRVFEANPRARSYILDDQAALRRHMSVFIDGRLIKDRVGLSDPVGEDSTIGIFQALSGG